jgi:PEP-CTERM motif
MWRVYTDRTPEPKIEILVSKEEQMILKSASRCSAMLFFVSIATNSCWATTYNPAATFEQGWTTQSNPNGVWSYGFSSGFTNPITLYDQTVQNGVNGPNAQYWLSSSVDIGNSPAAEFNNGPAFNDGNVVFSANEFLLVAGIGGQYSDLVFTAPAAGMYSIVTSFLGSQNGIGTVVGVVENGNVLFSSSVTAVGESVPFDTQVSLAAGNTVVFSVGPGGGLQNTGLEATITTTTTPEPSSLALLGAGILALLGLLKLGNTERKADTGKALAMP